MTEFLRDVVSPAAGIVGLAGVCVGALLGHWLAIGRERRKALHEVAQRLREELMFGPQAARLRNPDVDLYCRLASAWHRARFRHALERYEHARKKTERRTKSGSHYYEQTPELLESHAALLRLTAWR